MITATPLPRRLRGSARAVSPVPVHRSGIPIPAEIANNPLPSRPIEKVLRAGNFDVVHVHAGVGSPFAAAGVRVALRLGLPVVVTVHCLPRVVPAAVGAHSMAGAGDRGADRDERGQRGGRGAAPGADRRRSRRSSPTGSTRRTGPSPRAPGDGGDRARRLHHATVRPQAPAAAARHGARRTTPTAGRRAAAAHRVRRRQADAPDARGSSPDTACPTRCISPAGWTATQLTDDLPHGRLFSSRRRSWSRSASPRSRRGAPACRCWPCAAPGSPSSSADGVGRAARRRRSWHGGRAGADHAGRRSARPHRRAQSHDAAPDLVGGGARAHGGGVRPRPVAAPAALTRDDRREQDERLRTGKGHRKRDGRP